MRKFWELMSNKVKWATFVGLVIAVVSRFVEVPGNIEDAIVALGPLVAGIIGWWVKESPAAMDKMER